MPVKCDEAYPACRRCLSTGRTCDGYGIWGGGSSNRPTKPSAVAVNSALVVRPMIDSRLPTRITNEEGRYLQWFKERTVSKMSGSFFSEFWSGLVIQAGMSEPSVLHAVLALSSVHRQGVLTDGGVKAGDMEMITLTRYSKAINFLQPHFKAKNRTAFRTALIVCILFIALELLRGHFASARIHLQQGLNLLEGSGLLRRQGGVLVGQSQVYVDDWIVHALSRLHIQLELLKQVHRGSSLRLEIPFLECKSLTFPSVKEAWSWLHHLMGKAFNLNREVREQFCTESNLPAELLRRQRSVHENLTCWLNTYNHTIQGSMRKDQAQIYGLLRTYHTMITIMVATCLHPGDEMIFDLHTDQFLEMITTLAQLWKFLSTFSAFGSRPAQFFMSRSIGDLGWIAPLYYTAIKCRVHRIRLHAIRLLEGSFHREGFWDSQILAFVARKVMEIEEVDFYQLLDSRDDFELHCPPDQEDLLFPPLPGSCRLSDVEVRLLGDPVNTISILCSPNDQGTDRKICVASYDVAFNR
ncbi:hypothetical protein KXW98_009126 [Aspergillus fumigatus]|nr:hypothetical protein CNMCM8057_008117 [Aspergillus fumigatus]KMK62942.1 hypothetical protein Y699_05325 [Aspergillus fumigatus Z5]KAF4282700.1 hypothetical protein CNMCM8689_008060 [Aspergillus fumigatus]KAH1271740.1 hypothetical protein KXX45_000505 [Aspergillus fumigatus]KAH1283902.1 hypothetical protein KXX30_001395 [Aspergillus fumigatus]